MRDALQDALGGAERIARIVKDMRSLGGQATARIETLDVENLLELAIRQTDNHVRHRAQLVRHFSASPAVEGDASRLCQVFVNLLLNAAQAIPEGKTGRNEIAIALRVEGAMAVVEVCDTGVGIPPAILARVFEPFFTTKTMGEGTGLGLAISRNIVNSFGGEIGVTSSEGVGTTVSVRLPRSMAKSAPTTLRRRLTASGMPASVSPASSSWTTTRASLAPPAASSSEHSRSKHSSTPAASCRIWHTVSASTSSYAT